MIAFKAILNEAAHRHQITLDYNDDPVCPYCGSTMDDAWELGVSEDEHITTDCGNCEREFDVYAHFSVTYTTKMIEVAK